MTTQINQERADKLRAHLLGMLTLENAASLERLYFLTLTFATITENCDEKDQIEWEALAFLAREMKPIAQDLVYEIASEIENIAVFEKRAQADLAAEGGAR